jgi:hypothetical protein
MFGHKSFLMLGDESSADIGDLTKGGYEIANHRWDICAIKESSVKQQDKMSFLFYGVRFGASSDVIFGYL